MTDMQEKTVEQLDAEWKAYCMAMCREERDKLLAATDYIHMPDVSLPDDYVTAMNTYRQQLRDYPATFSAEYDTMTEDQKHGVTPQSFDFPTKP